MEKEILSPGKKAVVDGYLADSEPSAIYDRDTCILIDTLTIVNFLEPMCLLEENEVADYLATKGYSVYASDIDGLYGWILKMKPTPQTPHES